MTSRTTPRAAYHRADEDPPTAVLPRVELDEQSPPTPAEAPARVPRLVTGLALAALVAAVVAGAFAATRWSAGAERSAVQDAARAHAESMLTIDPEHAVDQARAVAEASTGGFAELYRGNADTYLAAVRDGQVRMTVESIHTGVDSLDGDTAWALSAVDIEQRDAETPGGERRTYRLVQELRKEEGRWLVSRVDFGG